MKVLVVYKRSVLELMRRHREALRRILPPVRRRLQRSHAAHQRAMQQVRSVLAQRHIRAVFTDRAELRGIGGVALVISVGGDGTLFRASHFVRSTPVLGVNSDPQESEGVFCAATADGFAQALDRWRRGRWRLVTLPRIRVRVEGRTVLYPALNDILLAHTNPAATSRLLLRIGSAHEEQVGSGLWVATAAGSTGAMRSAGGRVLPRAARRFQYLLREPFRGSRRRYRFAHGVLAGGQSLTVVSLMREAALYLDGPHLKHPVMYGQRVTFDLAAPPLTLLAPTRGF